MQFNISSVIQQVHLVGDIEHLDSGRSNVFGDHRVVIQERVYESLSVQEIILRGASPPKRMLEFEISSRPFDFWTTVVAAHSNPRGWVARLVDLKSNRKIAMFVTKIRRFVKMFGVFEGPPPENWPVRCDVSIDGGTIGQVEAFHPTNVGDGMSLLASPADAVEDKVDYGIATGRLVALSQVSS